MAGILWQVIGERSVRCAGEGLASVFGILLIILLVETGVPDTAMSRACGSFYLRNSEGEIINPLTGENSDQPFSTKGTCGACHDYGAITKGFHFQQGWEKISDSFDTQKPWVLSDGMMGKH